MNLKRGVTMVIFQYETVIVKSDINAKIHAGMSGLVMELSENCAGVMFTSNTGQTIVYEDETVFQIPLETLEAQQVA